MSSQAAFGWRSGSETGGSLWLTGRITNTEAVTASAQPEAFALFGDARIVIRQFPLPILETHGLAVVGVLPVGERVQDLSLGGPLGLCAAAAEEFARKVGSLTEDATVHARVEDAGLDLWVVMEQRDPDLELAIAGKMCEMMTGYPGMAFDFIILDRETAAGRDLQGMGLTHVRPAPHVWLSSNYAVSA